MDMRGMAETETETRGRESWVGLKSAAFKGLPKADGAREGAGALMLFFEGSWRREEGIPVHLGGRNTPNHAIK